MNRSPAAGRGRCDVPASPPPPARGSIPALSRPHGAQPPCEGRLVRSPWARTLLLPGAPSQAHPDVMFHLGTHGQARWHVK